MADEDSVAIWSEISAVRDRAHDVDKRTAENTVRVEQIYKSIQKIEETNTAILGELKLIREVEARRKGAISAAVASIPVVASVVSYLTTKFTH